MNYTLNSIKINSNWFNKEGRKANVYDKIGYKGLNLYFQLYKFRLHRQDNEHTFVTSISLLRKETTYKTADILELLKKMKNAKIIKLENVSRWDYLIDSNGMILDKNILHITALDTFPIEDYNQIEGRYYIYIPLDLLALYKERGLNEKYYVLYCLIKKWSQNLEEKMFMSIQKMSSILGFDKDYINQMIYTLNRNYFLASVRRKRESDYGYRYDHYILDSAKDDEINKFLKSHKSKMDALIKRVDKKKESKQAKNTEVIIDIEEEFEEVEYSLDMSYEQMMQLQKELELEGVL